ncbi:MAG: hypothetical protein E6H78_17730, partial [Betaproteobacteria bacterium]
MVTAQRLVIRVESLLRRLEHHQILQRDRELAVPECVKAAGQPPDHVPRDEQIVIAEFHLLACGEISVADVAPADQCDLVVDDEQLVVHAVRKALLVQREFGGAHEFER